LSEMVRRSGGLVNPDASAGLDGYLSDTGVSVVLGELLAPSCCRISSVA
jgi:hypothetical protein